MVANEFQAVLSRAKASLRTAQDRQKAYADQHRRAASFSVGERVLLSTKNAQPKGVASKKTCQGGWVPSQSLKF
jgi:hypothetical protein